MNKGEFVKTGNNPKEKEAEEKIFCVPIETSFEVELPQEVLKHLNIESGDKVQFIEENKKVYIEKA